MKGLCLSGLGLNPLKIGSSCKVKTDKSAINPDDCLNPLKIGSSCKKQMSFQNGLSSLYLGLNPLKIGSSCKTKEAVRA